MSVFMKMFYSVRLQSLTINQHLIHIKFLFHQCQACNLTQLRFIIFFSGMCIKKTRIAPNKPQQTSVSMLINTGCTKRFHCSSLSYSEVTFGPGPFHSYRLVLERYFYFSHYLTEVTTLLLKYGVRLLYPPLVKHTGTM